MKSVLRIFCYYLKYNVLFRPLHTIELMLHVHASIPSKIPTRIIILPPPLTRIDPMPVLTLAAEVRHFRILGHRAAQA